MQVEPFCCLSGSVDDSARAGEALDDRKVLCGILLYTGIRGEWLPAELRWLRYDLLAPTVSRIELGAFTTTGHVLPTP